MKRFALFRLFTSYSIRGLVAVMLAAFFIQILLLAALLQDRNRTVSEATQVFNATELFNVADLVITMDPDQRDALMKITNTPYARVEFHETLPPREPISAFERLIGINTRRIDIQLSSGNYMILQFDEALQETYGFFGQIGLLILFFFIILGLVLIRARAALQPVHRFARAAKQLSQDLNAPPMEPIGSRDLIRAAEAINTMQTALQEQVAGRTRLIAGIGHDLRTFITRLTLRAEFIGDEKQRQKALSDLAQMTEVVNQSLELGKADQATEPLVKVDLAECLSQLVEGFVEMGRPVTHSTVPAITIEIRKTSLRRAFNNLIENALRYGASAHISVMEGEGRIFIHIDDEGPGIPENRREDVLKPYVRLEDSRNRDTGGSGLGLPISQLLISRQGGELRLSDASTGGLRATISLPLPIETKA